MIASSARLFRRMAASAIAALLVGCSGRPYGTVPVQGRITFHGKAPPARCEVYFVPASGDEGNQGPVPPRPGVGYVASDGNFDVTSFRAGDGLLPGTYDVRIECWRSTPQAEHGSPHDHPGVSFVPKDFSPPQLLVPSEGTRRVRYDVEVTASPHSSSKAQ
jgi:hypothetical protein